MSSIRRIIEKIVSVFNKKNKNIIYIGNDPDLKKQIIDIIGYVPDKITLMKHYSKEKSVVFDIFIK